MTSSAFFTDEDCQLVADGNGIHTGIGQGDTGQKQSGRGRSFGGFVIGKRDAIFSPLKSQRSGAGRGDVELDRGIRVGGHADRLLRDGRRINDRQEGFVAGDRA